MRRFLAKLVTLFNRGSAERELTREVEAHLAILQDEYELRGMPPDEARLAARRSYGSVEYAKELHREERSFPWVTPSSGLHSRGGGCAGAGNWRPMLRFSA